MKIKQLALLTTIFTSLFIACACSGKATNTAPKTTETVEIPSFNADSAYNYVKTQVDFGPRVPGSATHKACGDWLVASLKAFGADTVIEQTAWDNAFNGDRLPIRNIFARYNPDARHRVILLAHWDTRPWADNDPDKTNHVKPVPGANDGASGVGVLLEMARQFQAQRPEIGVDLLLTDVEDYGETGGDDETSWCIGTQYWVENMPYGVSDRPMYGVLLDMVGGQGAQFHREYFSDNYASATVDRVWAAAKMAGYEDRFVNAPGGAITDDHIHLLKAGIPTIDIIESHNASTGNFPPTWHTVKDDMSSIDASSLKAVGQTLMQLIYTEK